MGSSIPMDAGAVETAVAEDAGSLGQRGVGPGLGKGGPPRAHRPQVASWRHSRLGEVRPRHQQRVPAGHVWWVRLFRAFSQRLPRQPHKGQISPRKGKGKGNGKGKWGKGKGVGGVDDEEWAEGIEGAGTEEGA